MAPESQTLPKDARKRLAASLPNSPYDFLDAETRQKLNEDLTRMAKMRRQAEADSANIQMH
jgi:hypothetical protein